MNYAYITLLSSIDFLPAVMIVDRNLKELNCKYQLYVMVTEDIYDEVINYLNIEQINAIKVPVISYSDEALHELGDNKRLKLTASKINMLSLNQFDKIVYFDLDQIFFITPDDLFNYPDGAMYDDGSDCSSTGILVCIPMHHNFEFYKHLLSNYCLLDGDLLDILWFPYKSDLKYHIPIEYSINILKDNFDEFKTHLPKIYGLHFCGDLKPWNFKNVEEYIEAFNKIVPYDSIFRDDVFKWYFIHYINPLQEQYPEIFITR